jgi:hypothetical protein
MLRVEALCLSSHIDVKGNRMKKFAQASATVGIVAALVLGGGTVANATTAHPEGGTWNYGVRWVGGSNEQVYSEYQHPSRQGHATACSTAGCAASTWVNPGNTAKASRSAGSFGNTAYYNVR